MQSKIQQIITIILVLLSSTACEFIANPEPLGMYRGMGEDKVPDGTPSFKAGWKAGCESGMAAYGTLHYKATHTFEYDPNYLDDDQYHNAWRIGFRHCRWYTAEWTR